MPSKLRVHKIAPPSLRGLPREFWWIWLTLLINWLGAFAAPMLAFFLTTERGYSASYTGLVISFLGLGSVVGNVAGGALADRIGRRVCLAAGHGWGAVSMVALGLAQERAVITFAALAVGFGAGAVRTSAGAALADVVKEEDRQRAFALNYWAVNAGVAVSAILAGIVAEHSYALLFLADAATTLACAVIVLVKMPETNPTRTMRTTVAEPAGVHAVRDVPFVLLVVLTMFFAMLFTQRSGALAITVVARGLSPADFSLLNAVNAILIVTVQIPLTRFSQRHPKRVVLLLAGLLAGAGFGLTALATNVFLYAGTVLLWTLGEMLQAPVGSALVVARAPKNQRGRYLGLYGTASSAAACLGPVGGGWILASAGSGSLWATCAVVGTLVGAGWAWLVNDKNFRPAPAVRDESAQSLSSPLADPR